MRYTTVIDISEMPAVYRNQNCRLLYLHIALKAGYHDDDRDTANVSIRRLAQDTGLTVSATRHALSVLIEAKLLARAGKTWKVVKWICETPPSPRTQAAVRKSADTKELADQAAARTREESERKRQEQIKEYQETAMRAVRSCTPDELRTWLQELQEGRRTRHHDCSLSPNKATIEWLQNYINRL